MPETVRFVDLFVRPPGDLLFFLGILAIAQVTLLMALGQRLRQPDVRAPRRYTLAGLIIVLTWSLLMVGALFALLANEEARAVLPPLERAASVVTILAVGWAFLTADHSRWGRWPNTIFVVLLGVVVVGYVITGAAWLEQSDNTEFNMSDFGLAWSAATGVLALVALVLVLWTFRLVVDAPLKLLYFVVLIIGYGITIGQIIDGDYGGDYAGVARLAFLAALPLVPASVYRMVIGNLEVEVLAQSGPHSPFMLAANTTSQQEAPTGTGPLLASRAGGAQREAAHLMRALGVVLEDAAPASIPRRIMMAAHEVLKVDIAAILTVKDANYADIFSAYDHRMDRPLSGLALNLDDQPTLVNTLERQAQRGIFPDRNESELQDLYTRLDIDQVGPAYFQPLRHADLTVGILVLGNPYSKHELSDADQELLKGFALIAGKLLALSNAARDARIEAEERAIQAMIEGAPTGTVSLDDAVAARHELQSNLSESREQVADLTAQVTRLQLELDEERSRVADILGDTQEGLSVSQRLLALNQDQQRLRTERAELSTRLQEAEALLAAVTAPDSDGMLTKMVDVLRKESEDLREQKASLESQLQELKHAQTEEDSEVAAVAAAQLDTETEQLALRRDELQGELDDIESELVALGFGGGTAGLLQLVTEWREQREGLQSHVESIQGEPDLVVTERKRLEENIRREEERELQIRSLQVELMHVAGDREAIARQRELLRTERDDLKARMESFKEQRAHWFAETVGYKEELSEAHSAEAILRQEVQGLADERSDLITERDRLLAEKQVIETERNQLMARMEGHPERAQQVGEDGVSALTGMIDDLTMERNELEHRLNETRASLATVENKLDAAQVQVQSRAYYPNSPDLLLGLVQELRTPMTSILGYTDLLLNESAGILGKMQREFLLRVEANLARLTTMLDELVHLTALDTGQFTLVPEPVDVVGMIEDVLTESTSQFRQKGLTVHLDLDDEIPAFSADRDAMSQVINQLLTNAYLVSPPDSDVFITAKRQINSANGGNSAMILVAVEDRGGGIADEDEARVFSRKYKAENPLIDGLGDTGVGMAIAKALIEAHGGKLWLEARKDIGSIFNFTLPFDSVGQPEG